MNANKKTSNVENVFDIEDKCVQARSVQPDDYIPFCRALGQMEPGQSMLVSRMTSSMRIAMTIAGHVVGGKFSSRKEGSRTRVGRIK